MPNTPGSRGCHDILVVDDDAKNLLAVEAALAGIGRDLVTARSGPAALRMLLKRDFSLILLDVQMPSMDGFETARLIRARRRSEHVPIIFVTAFERSSEQILEGYALGAVDFLFKPILPAVLRAKVAVFLALEDRKRELLQHAERLRNAETEAHHRRLEEERRRWEADELARVNASLTEADKRKDEFLAMLGHELRNPLAPLRTSLELLRHQGDAEVVRLRSVMSRQVDRLTRLVEDLLDVSRISSGVILLQRELVDVVDVLRDAVEASRPIIDERGHELVTVTPEAPCEAWLDPVRLGQVVSNLLNNAARYTEPGGHIELRCEPTDEHLVLRVIDDGPGIADALKRRVFEPFVQGQIGGGGMGVGLTLVKRLVDLHAGTVRIDVAPSGGGTAVTVALPRIGASETYRASPTASPVNSAAKSDRSLRIVVIEDCVDIRESLGELLQDWGYEVAVAATGTDGLELVLDRRPDLAIVDIGLPGLDGYGVARGVRLAALPRPPRLIALTGFGLEQDRDRAIDAGFDEHIIKPPDPERLRRVIREVCNE